jgi:hypothetical protein
MYLVIAAPYKFKIDVSTQKLCEPRRRVVYGVGLSYAYEMAVFAKYHFARRKSINKLAITESEESSL